MSLEVLQWSKESREDVNFVMEGKVYFNQATESVASSNWKRMVGNSRTNSVSALLVTLGRMCHNGRAGRPCAEVLHAGLPRKAGSGKAHVRRASSSGCK